jgi:hypothetical protein
VAELFEDRHYLGGDQATLRLKRLAQQSAIFDPMHGGERVDTGIDRNLFNESLVDIPAPLKRRNASLPSFKPGWRGASSWMANQRFSRTCSNPAVFISMTARGS